MNRNTFYYVNDIHDELTVTLLSEENSLKPILYHYNICPFCIRVRLVANFLGIDYDTKLVRYDDEKTPMNLAGTKMLPIWVNENGNGINESLDIISLIDTENKFKTKETIGSPEWKEFEHLIGTLSGYVHNIGMPHFIYSKEFDEKSREYFQNKKEIKRGPFEVLVKNRPLFEREMSEYLQEVEKSLTDGYYRSTKLRLQDILIASHLWGMYLVPEFQFSEKLHAYLQKIKADCKFEWQEDLWKE